MTCCCSLCDRAGCEAKVEQLKEALDAAVQTLDGLNAHCTLPFVWESGTVCCSLHKMGAPFRR